MDTNQTRPDIIPVSETLRLRRFDGNYAAFGEVVDGIETVDEIAAVPTDRSDRPLREQKIAKAYFVSRA